ncbi:hypothetical protein [Vannielia litorea]|uniref:Protocatechuate 3,4-dioxygenase beta subunit n=1 Tax=Vannielia litorea TaxID=1217970 RepID=A0A1N6FTK9_9RHOB|nr:hypothetical protein [Vannielia litorea]SIN98570.1 Protocatechuate 3,4-dioxygenase beta subunit [Vannielia litorea]
MPDHAHHDDHDHGFAHDLPRMVGRRGALALFGAASLAAASPAAAACVALPPETAGPFPADGTNTSAGQTVNALAQRGVLRRDLRRSFAGRRGRAEGVPLSLTITLTDTGCRPLAGRALYLWHCDARGRYSLYNVPGVNWLRGLGVADAEGALAFTTIIPGCYPGRWPHFHFEVFAGPEAAVTGRNAQLTGQLALPEPVCAAVYAADPSYAGGTANLSRLSLTRDGSFANNTRAQLAQQTLAMRGSPARGFTGRVTIPLA